MSAQALGATAANGAEVGELAAAQRVQQLQALIEASRQVASPAVGATSDASTYSQGSGGDFASALQAATTADTAATSAAATGPDQPGGGYANAAAYQPDASAGASYAAYQPSFQSASTGAEGGEYEGMIDQAAARYGLDPAVLHGLIQQESGFDPSATSGAGAAGLTQLMPGTASSLGVANPLNPSESIEGGARYLSEMMSQFGGNTADALAAYNAGPGAVQQYGGVPPYAETEGYVAKVLGNAEAYRQAHPTPVTAGGLT
jgi:soluble lytic murein transglycosylase-like protein